MGLLKVTQWNRVETTELVLATQHIVSYNSLSPLYRKNNPSIAKMKCVAVSTVDCTENEEPYFVVCESVDTFTRWVLAANKADYYDASTPIPVAKES